MDNWGIIAQSEALAGRRVSPSVATKSVLGVDGVLKHHFSRVIGSCRKWILITPESCCSVHPGLIFSWRVIQLDGRFPHYSLWAMFDSC